MKGTLAFFSTSTASFGPLPCKARMPVGLTDSTPSGDSARM